MKNRNIFSAALLFLFGLFTLREGIRLGLKVDLHNMGPGFFPFVAGILLSLLSILLIIQSTIDKESREQKGSFWKTQYGWLSVFLALCAMVAYLLILNYVGFLVSTFLLLIFLFKVTGGLKWLVAGFGGAIASVVVYLIFEVWLQAYLPRGILGF
jgi:putative tricarboxylic transport membrane protein